MTIRYIGSKARLAEAILDIVGSPSGYSGRFVDGFCGTGVVARTAALRGWNVDCNDTLLSAAMITEASLLCGSELNFKELGSYESAIERLNACAPSDGYIWRTYSPASAAFCPHERRYFTEYNARRIDGARNLIAEWRDSGVIGGVEETLLVADVIEASNSIANIAGTYGCFLKRWTQQSYGAFSVRPRELLSSSIGHRVQVGDVFSLKVSPGDTVYLDPPYTKRQYASYYHIPETIAYHDEPKVEGVAGLRPWKHMASPFCYKTKALRALCDCVGGLDSRRIFLSYSSQGHVALDDLLDGLSELGKVDVYELGEIGRYRPNKTAAETGAVVAEYLIEIDKD